MLQKILSLIANVLDTEVCSLIICDSLKYGIGLVNILFTMSLGVAQFVLYADYMVHVSPRRSTLVEKNCLGSGPKEILSCSVVSFLMNWCLLSKLHNFNGVYLCL